MASSRIKVMLALALAAGWPAAGRACSICEGRVTMTPTFRQEAAQPAARVILAGSVKKSSFTPDGKGITEVVITSVLRDDPSLKGKTTLEVPNYLPPDPPRYLVFCDVQKGALDPYRAVALKTAAAPEYLKKALTLPPKDVVGNLSFFFRHLDDPDPEVARDAFLEFARASDRDILAIGPKLDAGKLRAWIEDRNTSPGKLSLYAMLLGATRLPTEADYLRKLLDSKDERYTEAADGLLAGFLQLKPREGWELLGSILKDRRKSLTWRLKAIRTVRFLYNAQPLENRARMLALQEVILGQDDLADIAIEDLRRWKVWDLTPVVLKLYGRKGYDAPLMQRAILRYALGCRKTAETTAFLTRARAADAETVKEVEEALTYEKVLP